MLLNRKLALWGLFHILPRYCSLAVVLYLAVCLSRLYIASKRLKIRPYLLWNANRKPYPSFPMVPFSMTLSGPKLYISKIQQQRVARPLCNSWASCCNTLPVACRIDQGLINDKWKNGDVLLSVCLFFSMSPETRTQKRGFLKKLSNL